MTESSYTAVTSPVIDRNQTLLLRNIFRYYNLIDGKSALTSLANSNFRQQTSALAGWYFHLST